MNLEELAQALVDGTISLAEWQASMRGMIRLIHRQATIAALGGVENVTQSMWGYEGSLVKKQYQYHDGFVDDIIENPAKWLSIGLLLQRMRQYMQAEWSTFESVLGRQAMQDGNTEERRVLGVADHCTTQGGLEGCVELSQKGWQPIGALPAIGGAPCRMNCHCTKEYR